jgi:hypothetical protein
LHIGHLQAISFSLHWPIPPSPQHTCERTHTHTHTHMHTHVRLLPKVGSADITSHLHSHTFKRVHRCLIAQVSTLEPLQSVPTQRDLK